MTSDELKNIIYHILRSAHWVPNHAQNGTIGCDLDAFIYPEEYHALVKYFELADRLTDERNS